MVRNSKARPGGHIRESARTVLRDDQTTNRQRRGRHVFMQPATASPSASAKSCPIGGGALAWPIRREPVRLSPRGRQASRGGDGPCADPLEASKTRCPQFLWTTRLKSPGLKQEIESRRGSGSFRQKIGHCNDTTFFGLLQCSHPKLGLPWRGDTTRRRFADAKRTATRSGHT